MDQLQNHARKHGVLVSSQKQYLADYAGLFPIVSVGSPASPYFPIGTEHESPLEHNVRATDFLFGASKQRAELHNKSMNAGIVVGAAQVVPTLVRPQMLARTGDRINPTPYLDSPFVRVPLERRAGLGDPIGSVVPARLRMTRADSMNLYE